MFGKKNATLLEEAEAKIKQQQDKLDWYQRHYEKQQIYIEELYDVVGDLSRQLGMVLKSGNLERLQKNPFLEENSNFFIDLHLLFSTKIRKGKNISCYYGKELDELQRKFQDRDFKDSTSIHLTERLTLEDLRTLFKDGLWRKSVEESLHAIRCERNLDEK
ncbi:MAG: hypothetical protein PHI31_12335 [Desulfuromonadaceae bacterium]|nr:hypothetical protein [Desulfuromonadaceae bacterium]